MTTISDLTFEQINDAIVAEGGEAIFSFNTDTVLMDIKKLTGDTFTGLTDEGVIEMMYKLRRLAGLAQTAVNATLTDPADVPLTSFPNFTYGIPSEEGVIPITQIQTVQIPINANTVKGTN